MEISLLNYLNLKHFVLSRITLYDYLEQLFDYNTCMPSSLLLTEVKLLTLAWILLDGISDHLLLGHVNTDLRGHLLSYRKRSCVGFPFGSQYQNDHPRPLKTSTTLLKKKKTK